LTLSTHLLGRLEEPGLGRLGVGDGLLSGKGLGCDNEEGGLGVAELQGLGQVGSVNVGDKEGLQVSLAVVLQRLADHDGSQVGSTNTNVDDCVDALSSVTLPGARSDLLGELLHVGEDLVDVIAGTLLVNLPATLGGRGVSQSDVEDGSVFGSVDVLAGEHGVSEGLDLSLSGEVEEGGEDLVIDQVLGVVEEDGSLRGGRGEGEGVLGESRRVLSEQLLEDELGSFGSVKLLELLP
jgi:hypothetical protein